MGKIRRIDVIQMMTHLGFLISGSEKKLSIIFNDDVIREELALELINSGNYMKDNRVIVIEPEKADLLLLNQ